jgi:hypothetical protein
MPEPRIKTVEKLRQYLDIAMQIEHATIPPYLLALYSIHPGKNLDATQIIRVVVVEEMLHLTLAANLLNAVGGRPNLTVPGFVPCYPTGLPNGEEDFVVSLEPFSQDAVNTFLKIERPKKAATEPARLHTIIPKARALMRHHGLPVSTLMAPLEGPDVRYYSIGEFYEEVRRGLDFLYHELGDDLFSGDPNKQATAEYYYSGGAKLFPVTDIHSADEAIRTIIDQGEGLGGAIFNEENELAHLYRFDQLVRGKYYLKGDEPGNPTGPELTVDWNAVYPIKTNVKLTNYPDGSELYEAAVAFNESYAVFLSLLTTAYNGMPELLLQAVPQMFRLRDAMYQLIHHPMPGEESSNAGPTFEMATKVPVLSVAVTA